MENLEPNKIDLATLWHWSRTQSLSIWPAQARTLCWAGRSSLRQKCGWSAGFHHLDVGGHMAVCSVCLLWLGFRGMLQVSSPTGWFCDSARNNLSHSKAAPLNCQPRTAAASEDQVRAIFSGRQSNPHTGQQAQRIFPLIVAASSAGPGPGGWRISCPRGSWPLRSEWVQDCKWD